MGHKRAMTLPQLGLELGRDGLPVPASTRDDAGGLIVEEDVPGAFCDVTRERGSDLADAGVRRTARPRAPLAPS